MRNSWWIAPLAVCLVLLGVAGGLWLSQAALPRMDRPAADGRVSVPELPVAEKPAAAGRKPAETPAAPADPPPVTVKPEPEPQRPADQDALAFVEAFMRARADGDLERVAAMLAPGLNQPGKVRLHSASSRLTAYQIHLLGSGDTDAFLFRIRIAFAGAQPGGEVAVESLRVTWKGGLKVAALDGVARESIAVAAGADGHLYVSQGQATLLGADLSLLPEQFRPVRAEADLALGVGRDGWALALPSLSGGHLFWSTRGLHPLIGVSRLNQGGAPVITPLDLLVEGAVAEAAWAPGGERYVALAQAWPSGGAGLEIWDLTGPVRSGPDLGAVLGTTAYTVRSIRWLGPTVLAFDVRVEGKVSGPWRYDLATQALTPP